jgi:hypothetical protein
MVGDTAAELRRVFGAGLTAGADVTRGAPPGTAASRDVPLDFAPWDRWLATLTAPATSDERRPARLQADGIPSTKGPAEALPTAPKTPSALAPTGLRIDGAAVGQSSVVQLATGHVLHIPLSLDASRRGHPLVATRFQATSGVDVDDGAKDAADEMSHHADAPLGLAPPIGPLKLRDRSGT